MEKPWKSLEKKPFPALPQDFGRNFTGDPLVKIPWVRRDLSGPKLLVMEWIDGIRCAGSHGAHGRMGSMAYVHMGPVLFMRMGSLWAGHGIKSSSRLRLECNPLRAHTCIVRCAGL